MTISRAIGREKPWKSNSVYLSHSEFIYNFILPHHKQSGRVCSPSHIFRQVD